LFLEKERWCGGAGNKKNGVANGYRGRKGEEAFGPKNNFLRTKSVCKGGQAKWFKGATGLERREYEIHKKTPPGRVDHVVEGKP